jgi:hypothetical protein
MNAPAAALWSLLKKRGKNITGLAAAAGVAYEHLSAVLAGRYAGSRTWKRIQQVTTPEEQRLIVQLYGPVFGSDWVDKTAETDVPAL